MSLDLVGRRLGHGHQQIVRAVIGDLGQDKLAVAVELRKGGRELALLAGDRIGLAPRAEGVGGGHEQIVALIGRDVGDDELASLGCWGEIGKCTTSA